MEKLVQFIADNGQTYDIDLATVIAVLTPEEMERLGNKSMEEIEPFFANDFDHLFDARLAY